MQEASISTGLTTSRKLIEKDVETMAAIRQTALPQEAMELMKKQNPSVYNFIQNEIEDQDITTASAEKQISNSEYAKIIRKYQEEQYNSNIISGFNNLVEYMDVTTGIFSEKPKDIPGYDDVSSGRDGAAASSAVGGLFDVTVCTAPRLVMVTLAVSVEITFGCSFS